MRKWHLAAALATVAGIPALSAGCDPAPLGELVLIVKTDMAPPKDFNKMRIEVFNEGQLKFQFEGPVPGDPGEEQRIVLPSTLGLVAPTDPTNSIRIAVGVRSGGKEGPVRVVREVVTTIPSDRVAMLHVPIQFLCKTDEIPFDNNGNLKSSDCEDGKTCIAGVCETNVVDSSTLPDYDPDTVYGGSGDPAKGTCFDVAKCFEFAELIAADSLDLKTCSFPLPASIGPKALNLALGVESDGICNGRGCFVVLDANSDTGWKLDDAKQNVLLAKGVCSNLNGEKPNGLKVLQIVQAKTSDSCPQKEEKYPTCGPWSAVESEEPPGAVPTSIAGAQDHPISVSVLSTANGDFAYWTSGGTDSSIRGVSTLGGEIAVIPSDEPPRDLVITEKAIFWTASKSAVDGGLGSVYAYLDPNQNDQPLKQLATGLAQPDGIALFGNKIFWTEFAGLGRIYMGTLNAKLDAFTAGAEELSTDNEYPARIVADKTYVYWTNEGTFQDLNGTVARIQHATGGPVKTVLTPDPMAAPRALALDTGDGTGESTLYFATIADGKVWRIPNASAPTPGVPELFASGLKNPNGIAIDSKNVYITDRYNGSVLYKPKDAAAGVKATVIATGQKNPGTVIVNGSTILWVNEGPSASDTKEGSIVKYDVSKL